MIRRCKALRASLLRATRRRRGRQVPPAASGPSGAARDAETHSRPWSIDELGAAALELGLYPEPAEPSLDLAAEPA